MRKWKGARFRAPARWLRDLQASFASYANPAIGPQRYCVQRLADFDSLASQMRQETVLTLASVYSTADLPFYANDLRSEAPALEMLREVHVLVVDAACVRELARNDWLAPFDEGILSMLTEAGVVPIRAVGRGGKETTPPIYGIPLTRGADFAFHRTTAPTTGAVDTHGTKTQGVTPGAAMLDSIDRAAADGQDFWRFFLALVWSVEPDWPRQANGTFVADTPAARRVLEALRRSTHLGPPASVANRMEFLSYLQACVDSFAGGATRPTAMRQPPACWLLSTWGQRILIAPWGPSVELQDIGFFPLSASAGTAGCSLETGCALVMTRQLAAGDQAALDAREVAGKLAGYLLSKQGQRALALDQFQVPARPGVLAAFTVEEVAAVFGARRAGMNDEVYQKKLKAGGLNLDQESVQFGERSLALLRQMEATLRDPARVRVVGSNPLSMSQCFLIDRMLHELLATPDAPSADGAAPRQDASSVGRALRRLQNQLEFDQRFFPVAHTPGELSRASAP